jgi:ATP phosphoribosyltransferase
MTPAVEAPIRARLGGPLKLAIPRGALWGETLDALDRIGLDTAEMRGESRSLVFSVNGLTLVTMRPSDVPTYVEAGAADVGITGKDVLMEHADRVVYEILDLGYGACRMVLAAREGDGASGIRAPPGRHADRHQVPADRRALLRGVRPPGRGDRGEGLG